MDTLLTLPLLNGLLPVVLICLFITANGLFVAAEFSILLTPYPRIASRVEEGHRQAGYILEILRNTNRRKAFIATSQIGITMASLGLGMYAEEKVAHWLEDVLHGWVPLPPGPTDSLALIVSVTALAFLHVVIGEMVPQSITVQMPETVVLRIAGIMRVCEIVLKPFVRFLNGSVNLLMRLMRIPIDQESSRTYSKEEIFILIAESYEGGEIEEDDFVFLENIGDFEDRTVGQVMTPRIHVVGLSVAAGYDEVWDTIRMARKSRYPVYAEDLDDICGIVYYKKLARQARAESFNLEAYTDEVLFVPATLTLRDMLQQFRRRRTSIAIVQDEFQSTHGLVTMEDLLEDIFGEIQDESDREPPLLEELDDHHIRVRGDMLLEELQQLYDLEFTITGVDTLGGWVMAHLDRIPEVGDEDRVDDVRFRVLQVENRAVSRVELQWSSAPAAPQV